MEPETTKETSGVFLSYHEGSKKSKAIVEQLKEFLEKWGLPCYVVRWLEGTEAPINAMIERLKESRFFLQLFTDHGNERDWMKWELKMALPLWQGPGAVMRPPIILHTNETNLKDNSFSELRSDIDRGTIRSINLDDEAEVRRFLSGLLIETERLPNVHGPIQLPPFCQPPVVAEQITLEIVERFIKNFKRATVKGLEMVLADRKELEPRLKDRLERLRQEKGCVRMIGITLNKSVLSKQPNDVGSAFESAINNGASAELLILDLNCEAAKERAEIESPDSQQHQDSLLCRDSREVSKSYVNHPTVKIQFYRTPYAGLILFEDEAYVEIYHISEQIQDRGICGQVPILILKRRSEEALFELFEKHFKSVWNTRSGATGLSVRAAKAAAATDMEA